MNQIVEAETAEIVVEDRDASNVVHPAISGEGIVLRAHSSDVKLVNETSVPTKELERCRPAAGEPGDRQPELGLVELKEDGKRPFARRVSSPRRSRVARSQPRSCGGSGIWTRDQKPYNRLYVDGLRQGLGDLGWVEGRTIVIESRFAERKTDLLVPRNA